MEIRSCAQEDVESLIRLWRACDLTRPWNDPQADAALALASPSSAILGGYQDHQLLATVMVGFDGHRGWLYYLAVAPDRRRQGLGRDMILAAEAWLRARHVPKMQLMVRTGNAGALAFYRALGWEVQEVSVLGRRLGTSSQRPCD